MFFGRSNAVCAGEGISATVSCAVRQLRALVLLPVLLALSCAFAEAQGPVDAGIRGRVTDDGSAVVAVVQVSPLGAWPGVADQTTPTGAHGEFLVQRLPPGLYRVRAIAENGLLAERTVELEAGDLIELPLALSVEQTSTTQEEETALHAAAEVAPSPTEVLLQTLPVPDRQAVSLAQLDPSGQMDMQTPNGSADGDPSDPDSDAAEDTGSQGAVASYAGLSTVYNTQMLDGLSARQNFRAGPSGAARGSGGAGAVFGQGAVQSLRVMPHTYSARYGGAVGGVMAVATRTPAAHLHGTVFVVERTSLLAAANPYSIETHFQDGIVTSSRVKPSGSLTQFGGSVGAPVAGRWVPAPLRDRLGLFGTLETQLHDDHIVSAPAAANFYALSATQIALLGNRGVGTAARNAALDYLDSLSGETARHAVQLQATGRVDARLSEQDELTASYHGAHLEAPAGAALGQASDAVVARGTGSLGSRFHAIDVGTARWLHTFSTRWNSELRFQLARDLAYETPHAPLPQEPAIGPGGYAPQVSIAPNGFSYGTPASLGRIAYPDEQRLELAHDTQVRLGSHLLTLGADWSRLHDRIASITSAEGAFSYDSGVTNGSAGGLVDWITDYTFNVHAYPNGGCPSINAATHSFCFRNYTQSFGPLQTEFVTHELAGFVEDPWRVRESLTITAGARYDYTLLPLPQAPNYTLDANLAALALPIGGATETFPEDRNNFAPRVGIAWGTKWLTAQLGYGWFYGRTPGATVRAALTDTALASTTEHVRIRPTTVTGCPQVANQGFGYPCAYTTLPPIAVAETTSATLFASRYRAPAVQRASLALERQLGGSAELRVSYAMAIATQLPDSVDLNIAPSNGLAHYALQGGDAWPGLHDGETFAVPLYTQRLLAAYGPVTALVSDANATYHAATVEAHAVMGASLEFRGAYTFSRSIDYGAQGSGVPSLNGRFDPFNHGYDKGLSSQQVPHRFMGTLVWESRSTSGESSLRAWLAGWQVSALAVAGSGAPYSYSIFGGSYLTGGRESINGAGGATYLPTIGRNTLRLPAYARVDLRVQREFALSGRVRLSADLQSFNLLNTQSISSVETRAFLLGTPSATNVTPLIFQNAAALATEGLTTTLPFGTPRSSTNGLNHERQVELGLRVRF
jgi:hypothetical protein